MRARSHIVVRGAREHNLKNLSVEIPKGSLVVLTGPSGSGKSSLAFNTIYAEAERRFIESLSSGARQYFEQLKKPDVDSIEGLSPALSLEQGRAGSSPRSTVGTQTEILDYLRVLFARFGTPWCDSCDEEIPARSVQQIVSEILEYPRGTRVMFLAPVVQARKGSHGKVLDDLRKKGFVRVRVDGEIHSLEEDLALSASKPHDIDVVYDRVGVKPEARARIEEAVDVCLKLSGGLLRLVFDDREQLVSDRLSCPSCDMTLSVRLTPQLFSFNSPVGACPHCEGLGESSEADLSAIIADESLSISEGAITPWRSKRKGNSTHRRRLGLLCKRLEIDSTKAWKKLPKKAREVILYGETGRKRGYEGVVPFLTRRLREAASEVSRDYYGKYFHKVTCPVCNGKRLRHEALAIRIGGKSIVSLCEMSLGTLEAFIRSLEFPEVASHLLDEILKRLQFLNQMGLHYLSLSRSAPTLSGGEAQRIRLASQLASQLSGVLYVLDEPSVGLHPRDTDKLLTTIESLRDLGNSVLVVEHDREVIERADHLIELGPGAGERGGELVEGVDTTTAQYLAGKVAFEARNRPVAKAKLSLKAASLHNLKNVDLSLPLGRLVCVTGVSGSGKSSLFLDTLYPAIHRELHSSSRQKVGPHAGLEGASQLSRILKIDQQPIGKTPRSNPATYTGIFDIVRELFAQTVEAKARGYKAGRFSFNVKGGRCEHCQGAGFLKVDLHLLPPVFVECPECQGTRYNETTKEILFKGKSIADVLELTVDEALQLFARVPQLSSRLQALADVGLGYIKLGQSADTLSGGEAQRIKLSAELGKRMSGPALYLLDEPTTGLHAVDVSRLLSLLQKLVDDGHSVVVIEHNLDVIRAADWIIDMGPEGGEAGGAIVFEGSPQEMAGAKADGLNAKNFNTARDGGSVTSQYL